MKTFVTLIASLIFSNLAFAEIPVGHYRGTINDADSGAEAPVNMVVATAQDSDGHPVHYAAAVFQWDRRVPESMRSVVFTIRESDTGALYFRTMQAGSTGGLEETSAASGLFEGTPNYYRRRTRLAMTNTGGRVTFDMTRLKRTNRSFGVPPNVGRRYLSSDDQYVVINGRSIQGNFTLDNQRFSGQYQLEQQENLPGIYLMRRIAVQDPEHALVPVLEPFAGLVAIFINEAVIGRDRFTSSITRIQPGTEYVARRFQRSRR